MTVVRADHLDDELNLTASDFIIRVPGSGVTVACVLFSR